MSRFMLPLLLLLLAAAPRAEVTITPAEVFGQVLVLERETELIRHHLGITTAPLAVTPVRAELMPRHVWYKLYMVQTKLVAFRRQQGLEGVTPVGIEPREHTDPRLSWGQTQRLLTEIRILRKLLGIPGAVSEEGTTPAEIGEKQSLDVYNKLSEVEALWNTLLGGGLDPSHVYAQAHRLDEDVNALLNRAGVFDNATPPAKRPEATSADSLRAAYQVLGEVQRLQRRLGLPVLDLSVFDKPTEASPDDVFNLLGLILAELQPVKARVGLIHAITPPAVFQQGKRPAEVVQLLGYIANKLAQIRYF